MRGAGHRRRRLHRHALRAAPARARRRGGRHRQPLAVLLGAAQEGPPGAARSMRASASTSSTSRTTSELRNGVRQGASRGGAAPRRAGRRALLAREPARLYRRPTWSASPTCWSAAAAHPPRHLVFASSSSVYGANTKLPWSETDNVDHPVSLYAATKKSNELMAHVYSHLFGLPATGLRYLHGLRAVGPAGHVADAVRARHHGGQADPGVQPRRHAARLHLRRRHRRGHAARARQAGAATPSSTSATTSRWRCSITSPRSSACSARRRSSR